MRRLSNLLAVALVGLIMLGPGAARSWATTIEDLVRLKSGKTPVSDDVLIALIESDGSVFHLTPEDLKPLKEKGFSDKLIIAMLLTSARTRNTLVPLDQPAPPPPAQRQQASYAQPAESGEDVPPQEQAPVVVNVTQQVTVESPQQQPYYNPIYSYPIAYPIYPIAPVVHRPIQPIYWGFNGQRRPDTWAPTRGEIRGQIPQPTMPPPAIRPVRR